MYFDDSEYDIPHVASRMNTLDAVGSLLDEDGKGGYRFDRMAFKDPFDILGFFLGYMSGPILAESANERASTGTPSLPAKSANRNPYKVHRGDL